LIYASTNGGQTWTPTRAPANFWFWVAASVDGQRLIAGAYYDSTGFNPGQIFLSTDGGLSWVPSSAPSNTWTTVASSSDGQVLVGAAYSGGIYYSTNSGNNWFQSDAPTNNWQGLAISADGRQIYATENVQTNVFNSGSGLIFVSTNMGVNWNLSASAPPFAWGPVVCSGDGSQVFAGITGAQGGGIYTSTDSGTTWSLTSAPTNNWQSLSMSTHGDVLLAGANVFDGTAYSGQIYLSTNGGFSWNPQNAPNTGWGCVFCSADGGLLTAGEYIGSIYNAVNPLSVIPQPPLLILTVVSNQGVLSWPVSFAGFTLQTTGALAPAAWTDITTDIVQSGTNYFYTNSFTGPGTFFRLAKP
jgi:hypothetical protein